MKPMPPGPCPKAAPLSPLLQGSAENVKALGDIQDDAGLLDTICQHVVIFTPDFNIIEP